MKSSKDPQRSGAFTWYRTVPEYGSWTSLFAADSESAEVPEDWIVYLSDVVGSTKAIEAGRYKEVNTAGCLPVMALGNLFGSFDFPFVFGGDGITTILPPQFDRQVLSTLRNTRAMSKSVFDLELRLAKVPVKELLSRGARFSVATCRISPFYRQTVFFGDAVAMAEDMLKIKSFEPGSWSIEDDLSEDESADYSGFSCRWQDVPSPQGLTVSLVVKPSQAATNHHTAEPENGGNLCRSQSLWAADLAAKIAAIVGTEEEVHPIGLDQQRLARTSQAAKFEVAAMTWNKHGPSGFFARFFEKLKVACIMAAAQAGQKWGVPIRQGHMHAHKRREENRASSDVRKFDGSFKLIVAIGPEKADALQSFLDDQEKAGRLVYGMHRSNRALMTCMVHLASQGEVHFVDGADGGYTLAAKILKDKVRTGQTV